MKTLKIILLVLITVMFVVSDENLTSASEKSYSEYKSEIEELENTLSESDDEVEKSDAAHQLAKIYLTEKSFKDFHKGLIRAKQANYYSGGEDCQVLETLAMAYYYNRLNNAALSVIRRASNLCSDDTALTNKLKKYKESIMEGNY